MATDQHFTYNRSALFDFPLFCMVAILQEFANFVSLRLGIKSMGMGVQFILCVLQCMNMYCKFVKIVQQRSHKIFPNLQYL